MLETAIESFPKDEFINILNTYQSNDKKRIIISKLHDMNYVY